MQVRTSPDLRGDLARALTSRPREISEKHTRASLARRVEGTGWTIARFLVEDVGRYALCLLERRP
ncbi:MAG: hypothetical protein KC619_05710 [Myxococcales bacterium]|nr:hypothetical protein [Myxococcales bacterium]